MKTYSKLTAMLLLIVPIQTALSTERVVFRVSARESAMRVRSNALVRIPVVFDDEDASVTDVGCLRVYRGEEGLECQATDIVHYPSGKIRACHLYIVDSFKKREERSYQIAVADKARPFHEKLSVIDSDDQLVVAGKDIAITFNKKCGKYPGSIAAITTNVGQVNVTRPLGPTAQVWRYYKDNSRYTSAATFDTTRDTQRNISIRWENGPLFCRVHIKSQQVDSGKPLDVFQYVSYLIPRERTFFEQIVEYDCEDPDYAASLGKRKPHDNIKRYCALTGGLSLGNDRGGDRIVRFDNGVYGASVCEGDGDKKWALQDRVAGMSFIPVASCLRSFMGLTTTEADFEVVSTVAFWSDGGHKAGGNAGLVHPYQWAKDTDLWKTWLVYVLTNSTTSQDLNQISVEYANPVVGVVDDIDDTFDDDLVPLLEQLNNWWQSYANHAADKVLKPIALYNNWKMTGNSVYRAAAEDWLDRNSVGNGEYLHVLYYYNQKPQIPANALQKAIQTVNSGRTFINSAGYHHLSGGGGAALGSSLLNFESREAIGGIFAGAIKEDASVYGWFRNLWIDPIWVPNLNNKAMPYWGARSKKYISCDNHLIHYTGLSILDGKHIAYWTDGDINMDDLIYRQWFECVDIDTGSRAEDSSGWPNEFRIAKNQRHMYGAHHMGWWMGLMLMSQETDRPTIGITVMKRVLMRFIDLRERYGAFVNEGIHPETDHAWIEYWQNTGDSIQETHLRPVFRIMEGLNSALAYMYQVPHDKVYHPDFVVRDVTWTPSNPNPGDQVRFQAVIKNQGEGAPVNFVERVIVSWSVRGEQVARTIGIPLLTPGESTTVGASTTWRAQSGSHKVTATADKDDLIWEPNESNNSRSKSLVVGG